MNKFLAAATLCCLPLTATVNLFSQDSDYSLRTSANIKVKLIKKLKLDISPEFRYDPGTGASTLMATTGLDYRVVSWLSFGASYRLEGESQTDAESSAGAAIDYSNRFAFDAATKIRMGRLTPKARLRFSNFTDFDNETDDRTNYLRYRLGVDYDIKGIPLKPYVNVEFYQKMSSGLFSKARYTLGAEYALNKHHALSLIYSYADKFSNLTRYHIAELAYSLKF
ncbi:MAG TPA: hypothetical protein DC042_07320 [Bacteroidales bacterium]|nr:hypothetical protein [Bacteroidales bacterium]